MRRQPTDDVAAAARRRLALLGQELAQAGLAPTRYAEDVPRSDPSPPNAGSGAAAEHPRDYPDPWLPDAPTLLRGVGQAHAVPVTAGDPPAVVAPGGRHVRRRREDGPTAGLGHRVGGWLGDRLPPTLRGRVGLSPAQLGVVSLVLAAALAGAAFLVLRSGSGGESVSHSASVTLSTSAAAPLGSALPAAASTGPAAGVTASPSAGSVVVVDVTGKVRHPGVVRLPAGSRVVDAVRKAGGARPHVDLSGLNLARVLVDGEQIVVGSPAPTGASASDLASTGASGGATDTLVDLNTATAEQLDQLPHVGPVTAQKILQWRAAHHAFTSVDQLLDIDGIGQKTLAAIAPHVTL